MKQKSQHGGARKNAGRKTVDDKRKQINLYVNQSRIDLLGGDDNIKLFCYVVIEDMYKQQMEKGGVIKNNKTYINNLMQLMKNQKKRKQ